MNKREFSILTITSEQKKQLKARGHSLKPVIIVGEKGITEALLMELSRALNDHELVKVKINLDDRDSRAAVIDQLVEGSEAALVQTIGKVALLYRKSRK